MVPIHVGQFRLGSDQGLPAPVVVVSAEKSAVLWPVPSHAGLGPVGLADLVAGDLHLGVELLEGGKVPGL